MPHEMIREYFRPLIAGAPSLDDARVGVHDAQLVGRRTKIELALESAVEARSGRREKLNRKNQFFDDGPIALHDSFVRDTIHEEVRLNERARLDLDIRRRRQQLTTLLATHVR